MPAWLHGFLDWLTLNPHWGGGVIFAVALAESLAIVGILVPGVALLFGLATLIGTDVLPLWPMLLWATAGAIIGDQLSFWLGWRFKQKLWRIWPLSRYPALVVKSEQFFARHGGKGIVLGRFVGPIRPIIPALAGMSGMSYRYFTVVNVLSALVWAPVYLLPGAVFGASLQAFSQLQLMLAFGVIVLIGLGWLLVVWRSQKNAEQHPNE